MTDVLAKAIESLVSRGWSFDAATPTGTSTVPEPEGASEMLSIWWSSFSELASSDESVWFLSRADYGVEQEEGFAWNEFEKLSLDAAFTEHEAARVADFWKRHRPILLSVRDQYSYLAVRADGAIVYGDEPEFEEPVVASSFESLLQAIAEPTMNEQDLVQRVLFS